MAGLPIGTIIPWPSQRGAAGTLVGEWWDSYPPEQTEFDLVSAAGLPTTGPFNDWFGRELVTVVDGWGTTHWTVLRNQGGVSDQWLSGGDLVHVDVTLSQIPAGWALCDGQNGTPDLLGRMIAGAGGALAVGATGERVAFPTHSHELGTLRAGTLGTHPHSATIGTAADGGGDMEVGDTVYTDSHSYDEAQVHSHGWTGYLNGDQTMLDSNIIGHEHFLDGGLGAMNLARSDDDGIPPSLALHHIIRLS